MTCLRSEEVSSSGEHRDGSSGESCGGQFGCVVDSSVSECANRSSVRVSINTTSKLVVSLNLVNLSRADALDFLQEGPFDAFAARRVGPRSIVGPEVSEIERRHELIEVYILKRGVGTFVGGCSLQDGLHPVVLSSFDLSSKLSSNLASLLVFHIFETTFGRCGRIEEN